ncbi:MAG: transketolase C-terminal domain-containing protein [Thermoplasmataceae archaeon]
MREIGSKASIMTGNEAVAEGVRLSRVGFISAYPITPQTTIVEKLAEMVANREISARYVEVESEHSAMAAVFASEIAGVRSYTATSSQGLLYMHEMLHWVAGQRLPIVMSVVNRAIGPPWNIWSDQSDSMNQKDTGWIQVYSESNQEAMDTLIMGYRIAEDSGVMLPFMSMEDAFILSHTSEQVMIPDQELVDEFLPELHLDFRVDSDHPMGYGSYSTPDGPFMELKKDMMESMWKSADTIRKVTREFSEIFGRDYGGLIEEYMTDGAEYILVATGTVASTAKYVAGKMREKGMKVGIIRIRYFRPFPAEDIVRAVRAASHLGVIDRSVSFGSGGTVFNEVRAALYGRSDVPVTGFIAGIGGRDVREEDIEGMINTMAANKEGNVFINVRGDQ